MSKKTTILTVVIAAVLLLVVVAITLNAPSRTATDETTSETTETAQQTPATETDNTTDGDEQQASVTITYTDDGFDPASTKAKAGDTILVVNRSSMSLAFNSDDHPSHMNQSELNIGDVPRGGSQEFTVTKTGTWGFHNHDNASDAGTIVVE